MSSHNTNLHYTGIFREHVTYFVIELSLRIFKVVTSTMWNYWKLLGWCLLCLYFFLDFMRVIQDYWSFKSMQEFLGRVHLLQLDALLPSHSTQLIHLLSVFKEQMQSMSLTSIFDIFELLVNYVELLIISWHKCCVIYLQWSVGNITKA